MQCVVRAMNDCSFVERCKSLTQEIESYQRVENQRMQELYQKAEMIHEHLHKLWGELSDLQEKIDRLSQYKENLDLSYKGFAQYSLKWNDQNKAILDDIEARLESIDLEKCEKQIKNIRKQKNDPSFHEFQNNVPCEQIHNPWLKIFLFLLDKIIYVSFSILILYKKFFIAMVHLRVKFIAYVISFF